MGTTAGLTKGDTGSLDFNSHCLPYALGTAPTQ